MKDNSVLLKTAMAGLIGAAMVSAAAPARAETKVHKEAVVPCYGVNKCKGFGSCGGQDHDCSGQNSCKGQGWLYMPKESCEAIQGGRLTETPAAAPASTAPASQTPAQ